MGNDMCSMNTIIKNGDMLDVKYNVNNKIVYGWPDLKHKELNFAIDYLSNKGFKLLLIRSDDGFDLTTSKIEFDRIILIHKDKIIQNQPKVG